MNKTASNLERLLLLLLLIAPIIGNSQTGVKVSARVLLQGALIKSNFTYDTIMRDDLRQKNFLPLMEPYAAMPNYQHANGGGNEVVPDSSIFQVTGENAIVDWVIVELRDTGLLDSIVATRSALLTRVGNVVDVDGVSPLHFPNSLQGFYRIVVRHRNHFGVMSGDPIFLSDVTQTVDFTNPSFPVNGSFAMQIIGGKSLLRCGDLNGDRRIIYQGPGNEVLTIFTSVMNHQSNTNFIPSFIASGYRNSDLNMDGNTIFAGPGNERSFLSITFNAATYHWFQNIQICTMYILLEQIP